MPEKEYIFTIGRRKTTVATIRLYKVPGKNVVNNKSLEEVYPHKYDQDKLLKPFKICGLESNKFSFTARMQGGGISSQLEALRLALARALVKLYPETKKELKINDLLTRDPRMVERKKPGLKKARKAEQYSKR